MRFLELPVYKPHTGNERGNVGLGGFDRTGSDLHGRLRSASSTWAAPKRRMRFRLRSLAIVV
jgi:hypothetical protein